MNAKRFVSVLGSVLFLALLLSEPVSAGSPTNL